MDENLNDYEPEADIEDFESDLWPEEKKEIMRKKYMREHMREHSDIPTRETDAIEEHGVSLFYP